MKATAKRPLILALAILAAGPLSAAEGDAPTYSFRTARQVGQVDRVTISLEMNGDRVLPAGPQGGKTEKEPVSLVCKRQYDEKTLEMPRGSDMRWRAVRWYDEAEAALKLAGEARKPVLSPEHRLIGLEITPEAVTHFCPNGPLTSDELELVRAVGDSLLLDGLLPGEPVRLGQKWKAPDELMAALCGLERLNVNTVETFLKDATPDVARLELAGRVEGTREGAAVRIELRAKCRFDRATGRIDWFAMKEKHVQELGLVESGLDVESLVIVQILPKGTSDHLAPDALGDLPLRPTESLCQLLYAPAEGGWQMLHDRSWFQTRHARELDVFRRIERDQSLGLCKISPLAKVAADKVIPISQFQADVQQALGKSFGEFAEASQFANDAGCQVYRLVVKGRDGDLPAQWHYYMLFDDQGRQAAFAFHIDQRQAEAFGKADEPMIRSFRFVEKEAAGGGRE
jgi:quinol monooxygenase YgiN